MCFNDILKAFYYFKNIQKKKKNKNKVMFFDMQKYVYSDSVFNITYIVIKQILKKFSFDKIIGKKNPSFFFHCSVAARVFKIQ